MQARVKSAFEDSHAQSHPFVKELYKKARNNAKKYEQTLLTEQAIKDGKKINEDQRDKLTKKQSYLQAVEDALETLALFSKHYTPKVEEQPSSEPAEQIEPEEEAKDVPVQEPIVEVNASVSHKGTLVTEKKPESVSETKISERGDQTSSIESQPPKQESASEDKLKLIAAVLRFGQANLPQYADFFLSAELGKAEDLQLTVSELKLMQLFYFKVFVNDSFGVDLDTKIQQTTSAFAKLTSQSDELLSLYDGQPLNEQISYKRLAQLYEKAQNNPLFMKNANVKMPIASPLPFFQSPMGMPMQGFESQQFPFMQQPKMDDLLQQIPQVQPKADPVEKEPETTSQVQVADEKEDLKAQDKTPSTENEEEEVEETLPAQSETQTPDGDVQEDEPAQQADDAAVDQEAPTEEVMAHVDDVAQEEEKQVQGEDQVEDYTGHQNEYQRGGYGGRGRREGQGQGQGHYNRNNYYQQRNNWHQNQDGSQQVEADGEGNRDGYRGGRYRGGGGRGGYYRNHQERFYNDNQRQEDGGDRLAGENEEGNQYQYRGGRGGYYRGYHGGGGGGGYFRGSRGGQDNWNFRNRQGQNQEGGEDDFEIVGEAGRKERPTFRGNRGGYRENYYQGGGEESSDFRGGYRGGQRGQYRGNYRGFRGNRGGPDQPWRDQQQQQESSGIDGLKQVGIRGEFNGMQNDDGSQQ